MAIYRIGGYAPGLIRDEPDEPPVNTPVKGEPLLTKALDRIESYSHYLVSRTDQITKLMKDRLEKASDVAFESSKSLESTISDFLSMSHEEMSRFDQMIDATESLCGELSCIDEIYQDVLLLSDILSSVEHSFVQ